MVWSVLGSTATELNATLMLAFHRPRLWEKLMRVGVEALKFPQNECD